ncbi:hypothetical protein J2R99_002426 [Rhodopseudomonas julia]|uniref:Uncharacterized protein n=1 Tax=Rhodopseudomonas julia TaxID=200617 RepID=A0ABU0CBY1_9BRAD|nr:hypothetical protein [Rhodopseudomonas julia]MDQ0326557.1 hypothetical protein [Rhodopseudomonas julia]
MKTTQTFLTERSTRFDGNNADRQLAASIPPVVSRAKGRAPVGSAKAAQGLTSAKPGL